MPNINKNIIMQAGAAVANATNKAAGLSASTPEPGAIISAIQLVNGGRMIGPDALAHFTEPVRNKLLSLLVSMEPIQSGAGDPSPDNVRPISGRTGLTIYVSPTPNAADATTYAVDWTDEAGTVYGGTLDVVTGVLTVDKVQKLISELSWSKFSVSQGTLFRAAVSDMKTAISNVKADIICSAYPVVSQTNRAENTLSANGTSVDIIDSDFADAASFVAAMGSQMLVYELATPLTYQLTAQDIITLVGYNYIWSDSGDVTITE